MCLHLAIAFTLNTLDVLMKKTILPPFKRWLFPFLRNVYWLLQSLKLFSPSLVPIAMAFVIFTYLDQGQDIFIIVLTHSQFWSMLCLVGLVSVLWSWMLWYPSRLLAGSLHGLALRRSIQRHMPRWVGFNAFVVLHLAVFILPEILVPSVGSSICNEDVSFWAISYVAYYNLLFILSSSMLSRPLNSGSIMRSTAYLLALGALPWAVMWFRVFSYEKYIPEAMLMGLMLTILQSLAFGAQAWRRLIISTGTPVSVSSFIQRQVDLKLLPAATLHDPRSYTIFFIIAQLGLFAAVAASASPQVAQFFGPLPTVLIALALISTVFSLLKFILIQRRIPVLLYYFLPLIFAIQMMSDKSAMAIDHAKVPDSRPDARRALAQRLQYIQTTSEADHCNKAYIVLSDGGALRSGYWAMRVLAALEAQSPFPFYDHVLMLSSTSGGSIGNGMYYILGDVFKDKDPRDSSLLHYGTHFFAGDFLSHTLANMLGPDALGLSMLYGYDRGHALVETMIQRDTMRYFQGYGLDAPAQPGTRPLLFFNTTTMNGGQPGVLSNVRLGNLATERLDVLAHSNDSVDRISFADAMILSSRFPFVSPAGLLRDKYYVDGGYFDNTGAGIVQDILTDALNDSVSKNLLRKLHLVVIHITNDDVYIPKEHPQRLPLIPSGPVPYTADSMAPLASNYLAPLHTVLGTYSSQTKASTGQFLRFLGHQWNDNASYCRVNLYSNLYPTVASAENYIQGFPMSWIISAYNMHRMGEQIDRSTLDSLVK